jgi:hypothetical protein
MDNFTPEDLVEFQYNETSTEKSEAIKLALQSDASLNEMYEIIVSAQKKLEAFQLSPSDEIVNNILLHGKKAKAALHTDR